MKAPTVDRRCGTNAGYFAHRRRNEKPCCECSVAHFASQAGRNAARSRALTRLARLHPADFRQLYDEELGAA